MGLSSAARYTAVITLLILPPGLASASKPIGLPDACREGATIGIAEAAGARDGATIRLKNGREARLAGVVAPTEMDGKSEAAGRATAALDELVANRRVVLHTGNDDRDRYGRIVAQVVVANEASEWVQAALVSAGHARVSPGSGGPDCVKPLLLLERQARKHARGLWSDPDFSILRADSIPAGYVATGRFVLVESPVRRVGEAGGRIFLDFGRRFWEDFTIVIPREAQTAFASAGVELRSLSGRWVRARGVLFPWGGPALELRDPAALELIEADKR